MSREFTKSILAVLLALMVETLPRSITLAVHGSVPASALTALGIVLVWSTIKASIKSHRDGIHASITAQVLMAVVFVLGPIAAWRLGWLVWPHVAVSALFLVQPPLIWLWRIQSNRKASRE